jgi:phosphohistidine swiveling domain-containing protein
MKIIDKNIADQTRGIYRKEGPLAPKAVAGNAGDAAPTQNASAREPNEWRDISSEKGSSQVLSDAEILELSTLILKIEEHYGFPCDIEWAREARPTADGGRGGQFYIVQSRPITTLNFTKEQALTVKDFVLTFEGKNISPLLSDIVCAGYLPPNSLILYEHNTYQQFYSKRHLVNMGASGKEFFADAKVVSDAIQDLEQSLSKGISHIDEFKAKKQVSEQEVQDVFAELITINKLYAHFDFCYTDGAFELSKDNEVVEKTLQMVEQKKNILREDFNKVFFGSEGLLSTLVGNLEGQFSIPQDDLFWYLVSDITNLFKGITLAPTEVKKRRSFYVFNKSEGGASQFLQGEEAQEFIAQFGTAVPDHDTADTLKGVTANKTGKLIKGEVFILDTDYGDFEELRRQMATMKQGQVLVAPTTAPEHMDAIRKASAIIVDVGGMLSHTAIVSRELGIPSIVGTQFGSKILTSGDLVEVDAERGIVTVLERVHT